MRLIGEQMAAALERAAQERREREALGAPRLPARWDDGLPLGDEQATQQFEQDWERHCKEMRRWCEVNGARYPYGDLGQ